MLAASPHGTPSSRPWVREPCRHFRRLRSFALVRLQSHTPTTPQLGRTIESHKKVATWTIHRASPRVSLLAVRQSPTVEATTERDTTLYLEQGCMSVTRRNGTKIVLHRTGPDAFWDAIDAEFQPDDERTWRYLAMLALRENAGWPVERIGRAFSHNKGHVTRCLERIKEQIRTRFNKADLWLESDDDPPLSSDDDPQHQPQSIHWSDPTDRTPAPND
jgi:hypothetical protein